MGRAVPGSSLDAMSETPRPGRALLVYSGLRLALLVVSAVVLRLILGADANALLVIGGAVLLSALLSLVLLRPQRDAFTAASMAAADRRRAEREARRARLEDPQEPMG